MSEQVHRVALRCHVRGNCHSSRDFETNRLVKPVWAWIASLFLFGGEGQATLYARLGIVFLRYFSRLTMNIWNLYVVTPRETVHYHTDLICAFAWAVIGLIRNHAKSALDSDFVDAAGKVACLSLRALLSFPATGGERARLQPVVPSLLAIARYVPLLGIAMPDKLLSEAWDANLSFLDGA